MSDANTARPGDTDNMLLRKIANRLELGGSSSGSTGLTNTELRATPVPVSGTVAVTGPLTNAELAATLIVDNAAFTDGTTKLFIPGFVFDDVAGTALTENDAAAARIDSKRAQVLVIEDATTRGRKATVSAGGALLTDASATTQPVSGNLGGKTTVIKDTTAVTASSAYTDGNAVGGKRTLANAVLSAGTGILESIMLLDRANQKPAVEIYIFDADPTNATITDKTAFVFSTDDLKVLARISVATGDWVTHNSKATACIKGIGATLKAASGTSLYAAVVLNGSTPTFAATTDFQIAVGILQD